VTKFGDDRGAGEQWSPYLTIQKAIDVAATGDLIRIGTGVYAQDLSITTNELDIGPWDTAHGRASTGTEYVLTTPSYRSRHLGRVISSARSFSFQRDGSRKLRMLTRSSDSFEGVGSSATLEAVEKDLQLQHGR